MKDEPVWFLLIGALHTFMAVARGPIRRLPLTGAMIYLLVGVAVGPGVAGLVGVDLPGNAALLATLAEVGLVVSLFAIGMHLRVRLRNPLWLLPLRLGGPEMLVTVALMFGFTALVTGRADGAALFLAAALAPTDPVLANELRVTQAGDDEPVRFALSGEGGLNDGAAYPFAVLGLALASVKLFGAGGGGVHFAGSVLWGIVSAPVIGGVLAIVFARAIFFLRTRYGEAIGLDGFLALGLMSTSYGAALWLHAYAFVAGIALRHEELRATGDKHPAEALDEVQHGEQFDVAKDPEMAHAVLAGSMMGFTLEMERIAEMSLMLIIGCAVSAHRPRSAVSDGMDGHSRCRRVLLPDVRPRIRAWRDGAIAADRARCDCSVGAAAWLDRELSVAALLRPASLNDATGRVSDAAARTSWKLPAPAPSRPDRRSDGAGARYPWFRSKAGGFSTSGRRARQ